jgi:hypothetical protein
MKKLIFLIVAVVYLAAPITAFIMTKQVVVSGKGSITGQVTLGSPQSQSLTVVAISDEHEELPPQTTQPDYALGGTATPADLINRVRAEKPDYILVAGDIGHYSIPMEYGGVFLQSTGAVSTGSHTFTINGSSSYSEFGHTPNPDAYVIGSTDTPTLLETTQYAAVYDDSTGANFELAQVSAVTQHTVTATFAKAHASGFLMRMSAMSEYWDYVLQGKVVGATGNHDGECYPTGSYIGNSCGQQSPANILNYFAPMYQGSLIGYFSKKLNSLLGIVVIDTMADQYTAYPNYGVTYGSTQEVALRPALTGGVGSTWLLTIGHYLPANSGNGNNGGVARWALNSAVDMSIGGHMHIAQVLQSPRCIGSGCSAGSTTIPVIDVSSYTAMAFDPLSSYNPSGWTAGAPPGPVGVALSASCPGCTRSVLNGYNLDGTNSTGNHFRSYLKLTLTAHSLTWRMIDNTGATVCDYTTPSQCAAGSLTK